MKNQTVTIINFLVLLMGLIIMFMVITRFTLLKNKLLTLVYKT